MLNLEYLIEFENESSLLDFKKTEYGRKDNFDLIKDVMSMANSIYDGTKYIVFGVKHEPNGHREFYDIDNIRDQAEYETIIQENIEPHIDFKYYQLPFKGKNLAVLEISSSNKDYPYTMKKDNGSLSKGHIYVRKGSRNSLSSREDLIRLTNLSMNRINITKVNLTINDEQNLENQLFYKAVDINKLPSNVAEKKYQDLYANLQNQIKEYDSKVNQPIFDLFPLFRKDKTDDSNDSIRVGNDLFGIPLYLNGQQIKDKIKNIREDYFEDDLYFLGELNSTKINFVCRNENNEFLEEVKFEFFFPKSDFCVLDSIPIEQTNHNFMSVDFNPSDLNYPSVSDDNDVWKVSWWHSIVRHQENTRVFVEDLRVIVQNVEVGREIEIKFNISAKNLRTPINGRLIVQYNRG